MAKKTILTFLSQGAAAGAVGNFLWLIFFICYQANFYNFLFLWYLPFVLATGAIVGALFGTVVWLARELLKQELKWWLRWLLATGWYLIVAEVYNLFDKYVVPHAEYYDGRQQVIVDDPLYSHLLVYAIVSAALVGLLVGSKIHVGRILIFGTAPTVLPFAQVNAFSFLADLLLRIGSLCGLLVPLFWLAYLFSMMSAPWGSFDFDNAVRNEVLVESIVAILYFTGSIYVSSANPRRRLLIALALLWNVPMAIWILRPPDHGIAEVHFVEVIAWVFICLWTLVVVGRLISSNETKGMAPGMAPAENRSVVTIEECKSVEAQAEQEKK